MPNGMEEFSQAAMGNPNMQPMGQQGQMPPENMPMENGESPEPEMTPEQIKQGLQDMIKQMPQEAIQKIVQMQPEEAIQMLMNNPNPQTGTSLLEDIGDPMDALRVAGMVYQEILEYSQLSNNKTLGMMNPNMMQQDGGQQGGQQPQPPQQFGSLMGG